MLFRELRLAGIAGDDVVQRIKIGTEEDASIADRKYGLIVVDGMNSGIQREAWVQIHAKHPAATVDNPVTWSNASATIAHHLLNGNGALSIGLLADASACAHLPHRVATFGPLANGATASERPPLVLILFNEDLLDALSVGVACVAPPPEVPPLLAPKTPADAGIAGDDVVQRIKVSSEEDASIA